MVKITKNVDDLSNNKPKYELCSEIYKCYYTYNN